MEEEQILILITNPESKREGFKLLVNSYERPLYSVIRKMVFSHEETKDLLQDTFVKAWEHLDAFESQSQIYTWVYRIAVNNCLQYLKKKKRRGLFRGSMEDDMIRHLKADESIGGDELQLKLQTAILKLPDKQRLVFNMRYFEDMSFEQIAAVTQTSSGALRASYHLAAKKIEEMIQA
ncbi:MAG: sigma-70 family RNA polymerase sigma factor [Reichenbachiella sp.]